MGVLACEFCDKKFVSKYSLSNHSRTAHSLKMSKEEVRDLSNLGFGDEADVDTEELLVNALDEVEFDQLIAKEFVETEKNKEGSIPAMVDSKHEF